ncbi:phage terminase large subunit family protein [Roseibium suaedae]|uniref:Phage terminase, large subunit GpA n=1 Tax=Roseibium suaedae TaxID=735517 RepID=A0A1M7PM43_9HYPH|nr:terminase gpA endonuclease subunit [Roseibium suaedae]SHN18329.1 Phage terminase, large subunit GpA [Roseibium suaedae]
MQRQASDYASAPVLRANLNSLNRSAAEGIRPDKRMLVSEWSEQFRKLPEGSALPGKWKNSTAPYLVEPMDRLSPDDPVPEVVIKKAAQSGGSAIAESWIGFIMHLTPAPIMYIQATVKAAKDWKVEKLDETIAATDVLNPEKGGVVKPVKAKGGEGSTAERIRFKGGFLLLAGANSAATLRQHSIRFMVRDDTSAWTDSADGEGDPDKLSEQRLKTYKAFGLSKTLDVSTPAEKGEDIDAKYESSDQRRYYFACKVCNALNDWDWEDVKRNEVPPYRCHVVCGACGEAHFEADKKVFEARERGACWVPTIPDENGEVPLKCISLDEAQRWRNRHLPVYRAGYDITGFMSVFELWDELARQEDEAGDDPELIKPFMNTALGKAYEAKGDAPPWETLSARREGAWQRGTAPAGVLYVTLAVDVQATGLYWERVGWGPNKQSWTIDYGFLAGDTAVELDGAWPKLDQVADQGFKHACGAWLQDDLIGVDSAYHSDAVYAWTRRRPNALNVRGIDGWSKPAISGAENTEVRKSGVSAGRAKRFGAKVWLIGTYGIKSAQMVYFGRGPKEGESDFPLGYCHFPADAEDDYFKMLVSEYVVLEKNKHGPSRVWKARGANHWLDCRVYNYAMTHFANLWHWGDEEWARRAAHYSELAAKPGDLFGHTPTVVLAAAPVKPQQAEPARAKPQEDDDPHGLKALSRLNT